MVCGVGFDHIRVFLVGLQKKDVISQRIYHGLIVFFFRYFSGITSFVAFPGVKTQGVDESIIQNIKNITVIFFYK